MFRGYESIRKLFVRKNGEQSAMLPSLDVLLNVQERNILICLSSLSFLLFIYFGVDHSDPSVRTASYTMWDSLRFNSPLRKNKTGSRFLCELTLR